MNTTVKLPTMEVTYGAPYNETFPESDGYTCVLRYQGRRMTVPFYMGPALCREPEVRDVLECLFSDAGAEQESFEDWAADMGYDSDSRKAFKTYQECLAIAGKLHKLLRDDYDAISVAVNDDGYLDQ